ncbi:hypothetical protein [Ruegeria sp. Ofav3-42]|uniref:hypothetical protein n=1 Tax=Ruegeria sp. Ofav3-42 TaxID=2917759 RepID=UPI001EF5DC15|nr:hypothetical protein [Ruegeria sp. Ofav3-42]MCG7521586.1 hypothetical protein [Ruegeria sp. Ofav3-42]
MTQPILTPTLFDNGIWRGILQTDTEPSIEVRYLDQVLDDVRVSATNGGWEITVPVPLAAISEGVHCFVIADTATSQKLGDFTIIAGDPAADDLRSEVALLRAELDMLKRAFRRSQASTD